MLDAEPASHLMAALAFESDGMQTQIAACSGAVGAAALQLQPSRGTKTGDPAIGW